MLEVKTYVLGPIRTNCYFIKDKSQGLGAIIDPGGISKQLDSDITELGIENVKYILLTHGHFDHITRASRYRRFTGAKIVIGKEEDEFTKDNSLNMSSMRGRKGIENFEADLLLDDGESIFLGDTKITAIHTPGHTKGSICYLADDVMFSGDTIMKEGLGRTDFPTGSKEDLNASIKKLMALDDNITVYPGHGDITNLGIEMKNYI